MKITSGRIWAFIGIIIAIPVLVALVITLSFYGSGRMCKGISIAGIQVGELSKEQASALVTEWVAAQMDKKVILTALDTKWMGKLPDFGARLERQKAIDLAYAVGREGNIIDRMVCVLTSKGSGKRIKVPVAVDQAVVERTVRKVAKAVNRPHKDARIREADGRLEILQDADGIKLIEDGAVRSINTALTSGELIASLPINADKPNVTTEDLRRIDTLLARYTTPFNPGKRDRTHNLSLAARAISGTVVKPGQEFSYNAEVGPRELNTGFREAPIFVKGKMEPGVGGGICQVSSTLYNAVLMTDLKVRERHPHSRTVPYVTPGRDATVAYGNRDFKFTNNYSTSVGILTHISGSHLTVDIYGASEDKRDIRIFTGPVQYYGTVAETTAFDPTLPAGVRKVIDKGSRGARVTVYRRINHADGSAVTETVSRDRYPVQQKIIGFGPQVKPVVATLDTPPASGTVTTVGRTSE